jgi:hypothetical protein
MVDKCLKHFSLNMIFRTGQRSLSAKWLLIMHTNRTLIVAEKKPAYVASFFLSRKN